MPEWRRGPVRHSLATLVRQRVFQIACGYEDQNDATTLRRDPLLKLVCGRLPETGAGPGQPADPVAPGERGAGDLVLPPGRGPGRASTCGSGSGTASPTRVLLDLDGTDDPTHGKQEGTAYHGYYRQHMYHPLLVFDGDTDQLITAVLRPGNAHGSPGRRRRPEAPGARPAGALAGGRRSRCGRTAASPCPRCTPGARRPASPTPSAWCPTRGWRPWPRRCWPTAQAQQAATGAKVRLAGETPYQAGSWPHPRRVVFKAEALAEGPNTRFVVTTRPDPPLALYDFYVDRGEPELWIKDLKRACFADRLSDHRFGANQFRLFLHAAAYWLLDTLRRWLVAAGAERLQLDTLRLRLLKIGGRVREWLTRVRLHLASSHPGQPLWALLAARPGRP